MRILAFIEDKEMIGKILKHLGLWGLKVSPSPKEKAPSGTISIDDSDFEVPCSVPPFYSDPDYPMDYNRDSKPRWMTAMVTVSAIFSRLLGHWPCFDMILNYSIGVPATGNC